MKQVRFPADLLPPASFDEFTKAGTKRLRQYLSNSKAENSKYTQSDLAGAPGWAGRWAGYPGYIIPALQHASRRCRSQGIAPHARWKGCEHQLRVNLGFFLGSSPVLKSFYNGRLVSNPAADSSPKRNSHSFLGGYRSTARKLFASESVIVIFGKKLWGGVRILPSYFKPAPHHFFTLAKNRSAILTLLRRTCPRGQAAP